MSDCYRATLRLRAIRTYEPELLSGETIKKILEAGRWTGSAKNRQLWSFVVVTDAGQQQRLAECGDFTDPIRNAPVTIAIVQEAGGYEFDTGRVAQNMMLAADALGVGSCPVTLHREGAAARVLELANDARCRYAIAFGRPATGASAVVRGGRRNLEELVHHDRYGRRE